MKIYLLCDLFSHAFITNLFLLFLARANGITSKDPSINIFPSSLSKFKLEGVKHVLIDTVYNRTFAAGVNQVYSLSMDLKNIDKVLDKTPVCNPLEPDCYPNYIKTLGIDREDRLYFCGTNTDDPKCWRFHRNTLEEIKSLEMFGTKRTPKTKDGNALSLFYRASLFTAVDDTIYKLRPIGLPSGAKVKDFQEAATGNKAFSAPAFVSAHTFKNDYVYFFLHEFAEEFQTRKMRHARVCRICENDIGDPIISNIFLTFMKAHLVCKKETLTNTYYYDELQSTYVVDIQGENGLESLLYGVFTMTSEYGGSSAICRYRQKDIDEVMDTSQLYKKQTDGTYIKEPFSKARTAVSRRKCNESIQNIPFTPDNVATFIDAATNVLLSNDILPYDSQPLFAYDARLTSLVVDELDVTDSVSNTALHMLFVGDANGKVFKIMVESEKNRMGKIVEVLPLFPTDSPIYTMQKYKDVLYAGSERGVASFNLQRCASYRLCNDCVKLKDPYCAWSRSKGECFPVESLPKSDRIQDIQFGDDSECPKVENNFSCEAKISLADANRLAYLLTCNVMGDEESTVIAWLLNDKQIHNGPTYELKDDYKKDLLVRRVGADTAGKYECIVELRGQRKKCNVTVTAYSTTPTESVTITVTTKRTKPIDTTKFSSHVTTTSRDTTYNKALPTVPPTGAPSDSKIESSQFKVAFIIFLIMSICLIIVVILLLYVCTKVSRRSKKEGGKGDDPAVHSNGIVFSFTKNYKMNRKDSAKKELLKQQNQNRVYQQTTQEAAGKNNGDVAHYYDTINGDAEPV